MRRRTSMSAGSLASFAILVGALVAMVVYGGGCQAIVSGDVPGFTCSGSALTACPSGQFCKGAGCASCEQRDVCDGYDNDCNGKVDDGALSDRDGDGYPGCGSVDPKTGMFRDGDCDDDDPQIHPGATEVCNGRDDDCDRVADNAVCLEGEVCAPKNGTCVSEASACSKNPSLCVPPKRCDVETEQCVDPDQPIGLACSSDLSCQKGFVCGDAAMLTPEVTSNTKGSICTKTCCSSAECGADFACFGGGTGGNYCVQKNHLGRDTLGERAAGAECTQGSECRSGVCSAQSTCIDTCCSARDCTNGTECTAVQFGAHVTFACVKGSGPRNANESCSNDDECKSGVCIDYLFGIRRCSEPCCGFAACGTIDLGIGGRYQLTCFNNQTGGGDLLALCNNPTGRGPKPIGTACAQASECNSNRCNETKLGKRCIDVCCTDRDCPADWSCRAVNANIDGSPEKPLRCQPN